MEMILAKKHLRSVFILFIVVINIQEQWRSVFFFRCRRPQKSIRGSLFFLFSKVKEVVCDLFCIKIDNNVG
jgi:hypothetical protein